MREAMFWNSQNGKVKCHLCPHFCVIPQNKTGFCRVRKNVDGKLYAMSHGKAITVSSDPIEKKPFYHFLPGSETLSVATVGCNLSCDFCQNWEISQAKEIIGDEVPPESIVKIAKLNKMGSIAWTYTEPTIFYEYFYDTKQVSGNFKHIWVSNGYTNPEPIKKAMVDAVNIDLKGDNEFYKKHCSAQLEPVLEAIKLYKKLGIWVEITNLVIPGNNDSDEKIKDLANWLAGIDKNIPLHISKYHPAYKLKAPPTDIKTMEKAYKISKEYLNYVYLGNIMTDKENTFCHNCGELLVERKGFWTSKINIAKGGKCPSCGVKIPIITE